MLHDTWRAGHTRTDPVTPARIAYVAGYTAKKVGYRAREAEERVDYTTGEIYHWQPPFLQMSRRPGIGSEARNFTNSWRLFAVSNGSKMPVPRYLHDAWKAQASTLDLEDLEYEKHKIAAHRDSSEYRLEAAEKRAIARQSLQASSRHL